MSKLVVGAIAFVVSLWISWGIYSSFARGDPFEAATQRFEDLTFLMFMIMFGVPLYAVRRVPRNWNCCFQLKHVWCWQACFCWLKCTSPTGVYMVGELPRWKNPVVQTRLPADSLLCMGWCRPKQFVANAGCAPANPSAIHVPR